jgi:hypothetical protein
MKKKEMAIVRLRYRGADIFLFDFAKWNTTAKQGFRLPHQKA